MLAKASSIFDDFVALNFCSKKLKYIGQFYELFSENEITKQVISRIMCVFGICKKRI